MRNYISTMPEKPYSCSQKRLNEYIYECHEEINRDFILNNKTFHEKEILVNKLILDVGLLIIEGKEKKSVLHSPIISKKVIFENNKSWFIWICKKSM